MVTWWLDCSALKIKVKEQITYLNHHRIFIPFLNCHSGEITASKQDQNSAVQIPNSVCPCQLKWSSSYLQLLTSFLCATWVVFEWFHCLLIPFLGRLPMPPASLISWSLQGNLNLQLLVPMSGIHTWSSGLLQRAWVTSPSLPCVVL